MTHRRRFAALFAAVALLAYVAVAVAVWWSLRAAGVEDQAAFGRGALYAALAGAAVGVALLAVQSLLDRRVLGPAARLARERVAVPRPYANTLPPSPSLPKS
ncbi:MAG: hypothetical protein HQL41_15085 [Alphaproteobacteria bacterium]|nr:hypothetical protein [Alphaproteobacteria bacterium]